MKRYPLVSINVRTYNSGRTLGDTLTSVKQQTYPHIEVLISDGYSRDNSVDIAKSFGAKVRYAHKLGDARFQNYAHSKGTYIVSIDSDQVLDSDLIKKCVAICEQKKYDALVIAERSIIRKNTLLERLIAYDKWVIDQTQSIDPTFGTACPRFFRKSILMEAKWPNSLSIFDDTILYAKLLEQGAKVGYVHTPTIGHYEVTAWTDFVRKFYRYGKGYIEALRELPITVTTHSLPRGSYFSRAALSKPHYFVGLLLLYLVKISAAGAGMASSIFGTGRKS